MSVLKLLDIIVLAVILTCAFDALRQVKPWNEPWRAVAFVLVSTGAFGWIAYDLDGMPVWWWSLCLHTGFAIYAVLLFNGRHPIWRKRHVDSSGRSSRRTA
jgi:hypothetical protein